MKTLPDIGNANLAGETVLVRADLNVPIRNGRVTDATRIERFAPTVTALLDRGARVVVMTHLGRPEGEANPVFSTQPLAAELAKAIGRDVVFVPDCVGPVAESMTGNLPEGGVALLENLRFYPGETTNNRNFAIRLSVNGNVYVNDAFSCAHRAHASTHAIAELMPAYAGPSLLKEVEALELALEKPARPVAALVGGAKISTKIDVLMHLIDKMDYLIIGGGMANTFLAAQGTAMGKSLCEPSAYATALAVIARAKQAGCELVLPTDFVVAKQFAANAEHQTVKADAVPDDAMALDIGPESRDRIIEVIEKCRTLLWNGPLGAFELEPFGAATFAVALRTAGLTRSGKLTSVAGGGDTVACLNAAGVTEDFTYVSTAGGAFLEWLEGKTLPGIAILENTTKQLEEA